MQTQPCRGERTLCLIDRFADSNSEERLSEIPSDTRQVFRQLRSGSYLQHVLLEPSSSRGSKLRKSAPKSGFSINSSAANTSEISTRATFKINTEKWENRVRRNSHRIKWNRYAEYAVTRVSLLKRRLFTSTLERFIRVLMVISLESVRSRFPMCNNVTPAGNLPHYPAPFSAGCVHVPFAITIIIKSRLFRPIIPSVARGRTNQPARRRAPRRQLLFHVVIREWEAKRRGRHEGKKERKKEKNGTSTCSSVTRVFTRSNGLVTIRFTRALRLAKFVAL